jgi:hypothetical protein
VWSEFVILLGWEIGTGKRVEIPDTGHLAWFGQTQLSGKTTALEAIAYRGGLTAVAFITKQGEGGFLTGRMIPPYFSEPTNDEEQPLWRWVKSILEASQQRKMNFEESWIIRACEDPRQAQTLADVHSNIKALLGGEGGYIEKGRGKKKKREWKYSRKPVSGMNAGIYTSLKAYFDIVMPQLARLPYTKKLKLFPGLNVMDLREYATETQALVIRSVMEWVYQHEKNVRVIVPESQDFVPQGKNSPVKMACENLVRKAGANKNFMWLDSQDMAAVDKIMLRACSIVGCGVQTEGHEIDRTLASMFSPQLKPIDIARLRIGEFFVRTPEARVSKVYVQPAWMDSELHAQAIARGEETVASARQMLRAFKDSRKSGPSSPQLLQIQEESDAEEIETSPQESDGKIIGEAKQNDQAGTRDDGIDAGSPTSTELGTPDKTISQAEKGKEEGQMSRISIAGEFGDTIPQPGDAFFIAEGGRIREILVDGDGIIRHFDHDTGLPWNENQTQETIHEKPGRADHRTEGLDDRSETDGDFDESVRSAGAAAKNATIENPANKNDAEIQNEVGTDRGVPGGEDESMWREKYEELETEHKALIEAHDALAARVRELTERNETKLSRSAEPKTKALQDQTALSGNGLSLTVPQLDYIYQYTVAKAADEPGILDLLTHRPELRVTVQRQTVEMDDSTIIGRITRLLHEGYFKNPKNVPTLQKELKRRGCVQPITNIYKPINRLAEMGFLTVEAEGYQEVPEMKVSIVKE